MKEHFTTDSRATSKPAICLALSALLGIILAQNQSPPARPAQSPASPKSAVRANSPAIAAEKPTRSPTGGADLRANNPFALPEAQRPPLSTSGAPK
jgi:hypothetical protein